MKGIIEKKMSNKIEVAVYLPDEQAKKFLIFQEYYEPFSLLVDKQVFEQKNAVVSLFFDHNSVLQSIKRSDYLFSRKFDAIHTLD